MASLGLQHANSLTGCRSLYVLPAQEKRQRTEYLNTIAREELTIRTGFLAGAQPRAELSASFTDSTPVRDLTLHHCQKSAKRTKSSVICREERQSRQLLSTDAGQSIATET